MEPLNEQDPALAESNMAQMSWDDVGFGVGEFPPSLTRFNWGAYLLTPIWAAVYGAWPLISLWLLGLTVTFTISALVPQDAAQSTVLTASVVSTVISAAIKIWIGMNAAAVLWKREAFRLGAVPGARPRFTVGQFFAKQRSWTIIAIAYLATSLFGLLSLATGTDKALLELRQQLGLTPALVWVSFGWTAAETLLVVWLSLTLKRDSLGGSASKGE